MQYDTAGNPMIFYDMCGYCQMTTGGQHQPNCPLFQPQGKWQPELSKPRVRIFKYDDNGSFIKEIT